MGRDIKTKTLRFLYGKSGNKCAFPGCNEPIFEDNGLLTGECCHIEAFSQGGPRYNPDTNEDEKNKESNLVLMCSRHHKVIDSLPEEYTVEKLKAIKKEHEVLYSGETRKMTEKMLFVLSVESNKFWSKIKEIDDSDKTRLKLKMEIQEDIPNLLNKIEVAFNSLEDDLSLLSRNDKSLINHLKDFCQKYNIDISMLDDIPYYEIPFSKYHWKIHNLSIPNKINHIKMFYLQLIVKLLERLSILFDNEYSTNLDEYRMKLIEFQKKNYNND